jgi:hypothetical protein
MEKSDGWISVGEIGKCVHYIFPKSKLEEQSTSPHQIVMETMWSGVVGR